MTTTPTGSRRTWLQVSLRTALIAVTGMCVVLAVFYGRLRRQARAVREIEATGGSIRFDDQFGGGPTWLRPLVCDECFRTPRRVFWYSNQVTDERLAAVVPSIRPITELRISSDHITDRGMEQISGLSNLHSLALICPRVTDVGMSHLTELDRLEHLEVHEAQLTDSSFPHFAKLSQLKSLWLYGGQFTSAGLPELAPLAQLTSLTCLRDRRSVGLVNHLALPRTCAVNGLPLVKAVQSLASYKSTIDDSAIRGTNRARPVAAPFTIQPVAISLTCILEPVGFDYYLEHGLIKVGPKQMADAHRQGEQAARQVLPNAKEVWTDW